MIMKEIAIIMPIRNEANNIPRTMRELKDKKFFGDVRMLLVYDESEDNTLQVAQELSQENSNVEIMQNPYPAGFGWSLKAGFESVGENYALVMMADLCDDPNTIPMMREKAELGYDVVCGSRFTEKGKKIGGPPSKTFFSRSIGLTMHYFTGIPTVDCTNAFKLYKRRVIENIPMRGELSFAISMQMVMSAYYHGYSITEVSTTWRSRPKGKSQFNIGNLAPVYFKTYMWSITEAFKRRLL